MTIRWLFAGYQQAIGWQSLEIVWQLDGYWLAFGWLSAGYQLSIGYLLADHGLAMG